MKVQPDKLRASHGRRATDIRGDCWTVTNRRSHRDWTWLVSVLALTVGLSACANYPGPPARTSMSAADDEINVASLDPLNAPPPPMIAAPPAGEPPNDPLLLVPAQGEAASQRVPLGTLGASSAPQPAAKPPTPLAPRDT